MTISTRTFKQHTEPSLLEPLHDYASKLEELRIGSLELMKIADEGELPALHIEAAAIRERVERAMVSATEWVPR